MAICLVGLGSNLGDRAAQLEQAAALLAPAGVLLAHSRPRTTRAAGGPTDQPEFINTAALLQTERSAQEMLAVLQAIERQLGRTRGERWGPRTLDLDLLLYDQLILETTELIVPHPRLAFRRFVLAPAASIAREMLHPTTGFSIGELLERLDRRPLHVAVVGADSAVIAAEAARQIPGVYLPRPAPSFSLEQAAKDWQQAAHRGLPVISDYWVGEEEDNPSPPPDATNRWTRPALRDLPSAFVSPHLVIVRDPIAATRLESQRRLRRILQPRQFPWLRTSLFLPQERSVEWGVAEVVAAVEAMQTE